MKKFTLIMLAASLCSTLSLTTHAQERKSVDWYLANRAEILPQLINCEVENRSSPNPNCNFAQAALNHIQEAITQQLIYASSHKPLITENAVTGLKLDADAAALLENPDFSLITINGQNGRITIAFEQEMEGIVLYLTPSDTHGPLVSNKIPERFVTWKCTTSVPNAEYYFLPEECRNAEPAQ